MFLPGTVLTRREPLGDPQDVLRVVGVSPIKQASLAEWQGGAGADFLIVVPHEVFGDNLVIPMTLLQRDYEVTELPDEELTTVRTTRGPQQVVQLSPEQQFAQAAVAKPTKAEKAQKGQVKPAAVVS